MFVRKVKEFTFESGLAKPFRPVHILISFVFVNGSWVFPGKSRMNGLLVMYINGLLTFVVQGFRKADSDIQGRQFKFAFKYSRVGCFSGNLNTFL